MAGSYQGVQPDNQLVRRRPIAADANADALFDEFYRADFRRIVRLVRLLTNMPAVAEDLAQEAFMITYRHRSRLDNPAAFVRTAAVNVCRNWHRSRKRESLRLTRAGTQATDLSPESREMEAVVARLPYRQRTVLVLRYWLDLSERDIAAALACRPGTVKSLHSRALDTLRKEITS